MAVGGSRVTAHDLALDPRDAARDRPAAQESGVQPRVEMIGVGIGRADRLRIFIGKFERVVAARGDREREIVRAPTSTPGGCARAQWC